MAIPAPPKLDINPPQVEDPRRAKGSIIGSQKRAEECGL